MSDEFKQNPPPPSKIGMLIITGVLATVLIGVGIGLYLAQQPEPFLIQGIVQTDEVRVALKTTGRVIALNAREGDKVGKGQVLATITSPEIDAALAQLKRAEAANRLAQANWRRVAALYKTGVVPAQKRDEAAAGAQAAFEAVRAARAVPETLLDGAKLAPDGGALDVVSPIAGEVGARTVSVGELAPAGYPLFTLIAPDDVWATMNVREDQFRGLKIGQVIRGEIPALGIDADFKVTVIAAEGDFATWRATRQSSGYDVRSFEVRARPLKPIDGLRPGMSVLIRAL